MQRVSDIPTPALCVDVDVLERNLEAMASFFRGRDCGLRPHFKAHKTPAIAARQAEAGCIGFTCATVGEAEVLASHGHGDLLIANEVFGKAERLRELTRRANVIVAVDSAESVEAVAGTGVSVVVDVNVGMPRCGVDPSGVVDVGRLAEKAGLAVRGVMGYEGHATIVDDVAARAEVARASMEVLTAAASALREEGFDASIVSGGSTVTYDVSGTFPGVTEVQAGSYALMDTAYAKDPMPFAEALRCVTTVVSLHRPIAVVDAGLKAVSTDHGNPLLPDGLDADVLFLSDEHTTLAVRDGFGLRAGDRTWLRPSHVDPTVNLHDRLYAVRGDEVVDVWPVEARGYR